MPTVKPISVFLTENGRGRNAILDIQDCNNTQAMLTLVKELSLGKKSGVEKGWLTQEDVRAHFRAKG